MQKKNQFIQNILLEISLFLNKELLENQKISYAMFQMTQSYLLKQIKG